MSTTLHSLTDVEPRTLLAGLWRSASLGGGDASARDVRLSLNALADTGRTLRAEEAMELPGRIGKATGPTLPETGRPAP